MRQQPSEMRFNNTTNPRTDLKQSQTMYGKERRRAGPGIKTCIGYKIEAENMQGG